MHEKDISSGVDINNDFDPLIILHQNRNSNPPIYLFIF
jgi:hypothetical protein